MLDQLDEYAKMTVTLKTKIKNNNNKRQDDLINIKKFWRIKKEKKGWGFEGDKKRVLNTITSFLNLLLLFLF